MPTSLFTYHGDGMPDDPDEQAAVMAAWGEWMGANAAAFVDIDAATAIAEGCPVVTLGNGTVEVGETVEVSM
jgi:hypothetical protein